MNPYSYPLVEPDFKLRLAKETSSWLRYIVDFPIAKPSLYYSQNSMGHGEFFQPREGHTGSLAILIHGWGDRSLIPCQVLAKALAKRGIACFVLYLVFHSSRMPETIRKRGFNLTPEEWLEGYQTSVIEVRQIIDWASNSAEINQQQIAVIGISLGGMIAAISMAVDKRLSAGIFIVTGGNYENPVWLGRRRDKHKEAEYSKAQEQYAAYLAQVTAKGYENVTAMKTDYLTDPLTFAGYLRERPIMMFNALWDERVPKQATLDFWEACGQPTIRWFPATHASLWLLYPLVRKQIVNFLRSSFGR